MDKNFQHITGAEQVQWNLEDLYSGLDDRAIGLDKKELLNRVDAFEKSFRGKVNHLPAAEFADALRQYSVILDLLGKLSAYAYLEWSVDTGNLLCGKLMQEMNELSSEVGQKTVFFSVEWLQMDEDTARERIDHPDLSDYRHFLITSRLKKAHTLSEQEEKILSAKSVTGSGAWVRFFDEFLGAARYRFNGQELTEAEILGKLHEPDRETRREAAKVFTRGLLRKQRELTYIFNTLLLDKQTNDSLRKYPHWLASRNLSNEISDKSVESLIAAVTSRYDLVHRFYRLKKKLLGLDELMDYDRYAPILNSGIKVPWNQAEKWILEAFSSFHPRMGEIGREFFSKNWIHAAVKPGKRGGAYAAATVPSVHPYLFLNYEGRLRDVQTLAHELGHGVHQFLARKQGILQAGTPLTTAETASVFGEMLIFQKMMNTLADPREKLAMLISKIDDAMATVFRQVSMNRFEDLVHRARREEGELSPDRFSDLWIETQESVYGDSVTLTESYRIWWSYIPHFLHTPGYVYAYAFGELLVLALYQEYLNAGDHFPEKYLRMLERGGSDWPDRLVADLGVDIQADTFWQRGLLAVDSLVTQAEQLAKDLS